MSFVLFSTLISFFTSNFCTILLISYDYFIECMNVNVCYNYQRLGFFNLSYLAISYISCLHTTTAITNFSSYIEENEFIQCLQRLEGSF